MRVCQGACHYRRRVASESVCVNWIDRRPPRQIAFALLAVNGTVLEHEAMHELTANRCLAAVGIFFYKRHARCGRLRSLASEQVVLVGACRNASIRQFDEIR